VNRTLVGLLEDRTQELQESYGISWRITGVASRRLGWIANAEGLEPAAVLALNSDLTSSLLWTEPAPSTSSEQALSLLKGVSAPHRPQNVREWLATAKANVLFEATSLNVENGQPAADHIRAALEQGAHAITANKGPIVHAYRELRDLAEARGKRFLFESTVMDGVPIFSLFHELPAIRLKGFHGILNSTTNVILSEMEKGLSFEAALKKAQDLGIAETDATHDIDGWDAAVKTAALITVLMDVPVRLNEIEREGIRGLSGDAVRAARKEGSSYKLVCRARRAESGITASVRPEQVAMSDPMAGISGTSSYVYFKTDIFPGLAITEENPGLYATAYGMLADFVRAAQRQPRFIVPVPSP
jgi:homoserine dehydrogenase